MNPGYYWQKQPGLSVNQIETGSAKNERILLVKNKAVRFQDARIVYRGTQDGSLVMDLFILALDPHYGYVHRIDRGRAHHGFSIGAYHFKVLAASDDKISLKCL